jgi:hypothetical protein
MEEGLRGQSAECGGAGEAGDGFADAEMRNISATGSIDRRAVEQVLDSVIHTRYTY